MGIAEIDRMQIELVTASGPLIDDKGKKSFLGKNSNIFKDQYDSLTGIKLMYEGPDKIIYVVSDHNNFGCINYNLNKAIGWAPFNFPTDNGKQKIITKIWIDGEAILASLTINVVEQIERLAPFGQGNTHKGTVKGDLIEGTVQAGEGAGQKQLPWSAKLTQRGDLRTFQSSASPQ